MNAQASLQQMLGLDQPYRIAGTTPDGEHSAPLIAEKAVSLLTDQQLAGLHALYHATQAIKNGQLPAPQPAIQSPIAGNAQQNSASGTSLSVGNEKISSPGALGTSDASSYDDPLTIDVTATESPST